MEHSDENKLSETLGENRLNREKKTLKIFSSISPERGFS